MKQQSQPEPLWSKNFILLLVSAVFMYISTFMFTPTLPLYARNIGAVNPSVGGFIILVYTVGSLVPRVLWGNLADRWQRKPVFLIGVIIMAAAAPFFGLFMSLPGILIIRLIQGVGFSASSTSGSTMAVDLVPSSRMTEGIGVYTLANTVGMALGPDLGLNILQKRGAQWLFRAGVMSGIVSLGLIMFLNYEKKRGVNRLTPNPANTAIPDTEVASLRAVKLSSKHVKLFERSVLTTSLVAFFAVMPYGAIMAYIASYGIDRGVDNIGLYFSVYALSLFFVRLVIGRLSDQYGETVVIIPGIALMLGGLIVLNWANNLAVFMLSAVLFGLGFGVIFPLLQSIAYMFCPEGSRGAASATLFSTTDLAYGLGAVIVGFGIKSVGYAAAFAGLAIFVIISFIFYMMLIYPRLKSYRNEKADSGIESVKNNSNNMHNNAV
ncbi:MAG: MFS transporter [Lachnospiraceae bacterium]|nr:MFS transporter [Lachnospiraceae bacterium]